MSVRRVTRQAPPPAYVAPIAYNWSGFYVGINGGGGFGRSDWSGFGTGGFDVSGGMVGGTIGYNYQAGPWVFGVEGDLDWTNLNGSTTAGGCGVVACETRNSWLGTARGRVGYAWDRVLAYATGGLAVGDIEANRAGFSSVKDTNAGWTVGGGLEFGLTQNASIKGEYLYVDLGSLNCGTGVCGAATDVSLKSHVVRGGLNFRF
jgi:outer membrane immunogenic protein